ncbi:hypothetical protein ABWW58_07275 [Sporolactobacillus sp. STCC-11]|uniref:hypothetical protein n=1 Tax=Sporolactobacillus caesalpiniae TaxID=3230362 RepID=UPI0033942759
MRNIIKYILSIFLIGCFGFIIGIGINSLSGTNAEAKTNAQPKESSLVFQKGIAAISSAPDTFKEHIKLPKQIPFNNSSKINSLDSVNSKDESNKVSIESNFRKEGDGNVFEAEYTDSQGIFLVTIYGSKTEFITDPNSPIAYSKSIVNISKDSNAVYLDNDYAQQLFWTDESTGYLYRLAVIKDTSDRNEKVTISDFEKVIASLTELE